MGNNKLRIVQNNIENRFGLADIPEENLPKPRRFGTTHFEIVDFNSDLREGFTNFQPIKSGQQRVFSDNRTPENTTYWQAKRKNELEEIRKEQEKLGSGVSFGLGSYISRLQAELPNPLSNKYDSLTQDQKDEIAIVFQQVAIPQKGIECNIKEPNVLDILKAAELTEMENGKLVYTNKEGGAESLAYIICSYDANRTPTMKGKDELTFDSDFGKLNSYQKATYNHLLSPQQQKTVRKVWEVAKNLKQHKRYNQTSIPTNVNHALYESGIIESSGFKFCLSRAIKPSSYLGELIETRVSRKPENQIKAFNKLYFG